MDIDEKSQKNILLVEDDAITAMMEEHLLKKSGYSVHHVMSGEAAVEAVLDKSFLSDLILMDIDLGPGIDGTVAAEKILRVKDIPLLFLSSHTEPEVVDKTEKITSYGYVVKNTGITVLDASIKMAFKLFEAKMAEKHQREALTLSEEKYRLMILNSPNIILMQNADGSTGYISPQVEKILGYTPDEIKSMNIFEKIHSEDLPGVMEAFHHAVSGHELIDFEYRLYHKDGNPVWLRHTARPAFVDGAFAGIYNTISDITERKLAEQKIQEERDRLINILNTLPYGVIIGNRDHMFEYMNPTMEKEFGPYKEETCYTYLHNREDACAWCNTQEILSGKSMQWEMKIPEKNQTYEVFAMPFRNPDGSISKLEIFNNITARKKAEKEVLENRNLLNELINQSPVAYELYDENGLLLHLNLSSEKMWGISKDKTVGIYNILQSKKLAEMGFLDFIRPVFSGESISLPDMEFDYSDEPVANGQGNKRWITTIAYPIKNQAGKVQNIVVLHEDITQRKLVERELEDTRDTLNFALEKSHTGQWYLDLVNHTAVRSLEHDRIFGYESLLPEWTYEMFLEHVLPEDRERVDSLFKKANEEKTNWNFECRILRVDGKVRWIWVTGGPKLDASGQPRHLAGIVQDITERKLAEEALRETEFNFSVAFHSSPASQVIISYPEGVIIDVNRAYCHMMGYDRENIIGRNTQDINFWSNPGDREAAFKEFIEKGRIQGRETIHKNSKGELRTAIASVEPIELKGQKCTISTLIDITERKRAEEALAANRNMLQSALASMTDAVFISDTEGRFIEFNDAFAAFHKFKNKEEYLKTLSEYPDILDVYMDTGELAPLDQWAVPRALRGELVTNAEYGLRRKDTGKTWIGSYNFGPIHDKDGNIVGSVVVGRDITEFKQKEIVLQESEKKYRHLFETMAQGVVYQAADGKIISANPAAEQIIGLTLDQMMGKTSTDTRWRAIREDGSDFPGDKHPAMVALKTGKHVGPLIMGVFDPAKDEHVWISINATPLFKENEKTPYQVYTTFDDITERKRAEDEIQRQLHEKEILLKEIHHRIKNNFGSIENILVIEADSTTNTETRSILRDIINKIVSIRLIYEKLLMAENYKECSIKSYLEEIIAAIINTLPCSSKISMEVNIEDIVVNVKDLFPIGIIINELITNSIKYAFVDRDSGKIHVDLSKKGNIVTLLIEDNGKGLPEKVDASKPEGFGIKLVQSLAIQLKGSAVFENRNGTRCVITFSI